MATTDEILKLMIAERDRLDKAIVILGGHAPASIQPKPAAKPVAKKRTMSPETRKKLAAKAKAMWAKRKAAAR